MEEIWKGEHSLEEFTNEKNFKSYVELKEKMERVLGIVTNQTPSHDEAAPFDGGKPMTPAQAAVTHPITETHVAAETAGDSDEYSYFAKLAEQE
jgi:hypothetical protein